MFKKGCVTGALKTRKRKRGRIAHREGKLKGRTLYRIGQVASERKSKKKRKKGVGERGSKDSPTNGPRGRIEEKKGTKGQCHPNFKENRGANALASLKRKTRGGKLGKTSFQKSRGELLCNDPGVPWPGDSPRKEKKKKKRRRGGGMQRAWRPKDRNGNRLRGLKNTTGGPRGKIQKGEIYHVAKWSKQEKKSGVR